MISAFRLDKENLIIKNFILILTLCRGFVKKKSFKDAKFIHNILYIPNSTSLQTMYEKMNIMLIFKVGNLKHYFNQMKLLSNLQI